VTLVDVHAVCVGQVEEIAPGTRSAIRKRPVAGETVGVGPLMTGWYLAVVSPGTAPTTGPIDVVARGTGPTIADVLRGRRT
jgi:MOSC domain-containing protein YiiM